MAPVTLTTATLSAASLESEYHFSTTRLSRWKYCEKAPALPTAESTAMPATIQPARANQRPQGFACSRITRVGGCCDSICMEEGFA